MKRSSVQFLQLLTLLTIVFSLRVESAPVPDPTTIIGIWHVEDNKGTVEIYQREGHYFGKIASLTRPNWPDDEKNGLAGKPRTDRFNPDSALHNRPLIGLEFMHDFAYMGKGQWDNGRIYDPETGRTYRCKMSLNAAGKLQVHGYYGISLLGRTVTWNR